MVVQHNPAGDVVNAAIGPGGWNRTAAGVVRDLRMDELSALRLENAVFFPTQLKSLVRNMRVDGSDKIADHSTWVVTGEMDLLPLVKLYFDRDSGYLVGLQWEQQSYFCCHVYREEFSDFKVVGGGIRQPMTWRINGPRQTITEYRMDAVELNGIEDAKFAKPSTNRASN